MAFRRSKFSKYKVRIDGKGKIDRTFDGRIFDSLLEMRYYRDIICPKINSGELIDVKFQVKFTLQKSFHYDGKLIREINYVADFVVVDKNNIETVLELKGIADGISKIKRKLFMYKFPQIRYEWWGYSKIDGGFLPYDEISIARSKRKREKK